MSLKQFSNSIRSIWRNPHIHRGKAIACHFQWQWRKIWNLFPVEQRISRSRIMAPHKTCGVGALINSQGLYNYDNMQLIQWLLRDGGVFFDVGANIGSYSLLASELPKARVFSFEPHPVTFQTLQQNVALNYRTNISLFNLALGKHDGEAFLTDLPGGATNHFQSRSMEKAISIRCAKGSTLCVEHQVVPQYMKLDVEGFEYDVLEGFGKELAHLDVLFIEMNGLSDLRSHGQQAIHALLGDHGLTGPFCCDFDRRSFTSRVIRETTEDQIYLSRSAWSCLQTKGWHIGD